MVLTVSCGVNCVMLGSHEHREYLFEKEAQHDKLLVIWFISKYDHYHPKYGHLWAKPEGVTIMTIHINHIFLLVDLNRMHVV